MLTNKILENENIIVTVPDYLENDYVSEELEETEPEEPEEPEETEPEEPEPIVIESNFDDTNILIQLQNIQTVQTYTLSFCAGICVLFLLYLCVKFFKIFF